MFHVGSQNLSPERWREALATVAEVMERFDGRVDMIDIGGGIPANTREEKLTDTWPAIGATVIEAADQFRDDGRVRDVDESTAAR
jgi:diaminopimelate decarboxylase